MQIIDFVSDNPYCIINNIPTAEFVHLFASRQIEWLDMQTARCYYGNLIKNLHDAVSAQFHTGRIVGYKLDGEYTLQSKNIRDKSVPIIYWCDLGDPDHTDSDINLDDLI